MHKSTLSRVASGRVAEAAAAAYLSLKGWTIVKRNHRCPRGEVDIIAQDNEVLVFIEVKSAWRGGGPELAFRIAERKQKRLILAARDYLADAPQPSGGVRFDAILMKAAVNGEWQIGHLIDAFRPGDDEDCSL